MTRLIDIGRATRRRRPPGVLTLLYKIAAPLTVANPDQKKKMAQGRRKPLKRLDSEKEIQDNPSLFL